MTPSPIEVLRTAIQTYGYVDDWQAALADVEKLVEAADELRLYEPGRKGYAAAQARLFLALRPFFVG